MKNTYEKLCNKFAEVIGHEATFKCVQRYDGKFVVQFNFITNED